MKSWSTSIPLQRSSGPTLGPKVSRRVADNQELGINKRIANDY